MGFIQCLQCWKTFFRVNQERSGVGGGHFVIPRFAIGYVVPALHFFGEWTPDPIPVKQAPHLVEPDSTSSLDPAGPLRSVSRVQFPDEFPAGVYGFTVKE